MVAFDVSEENLSKNSRKSKKLSQEDVDEIRTNLTDILCECFDALKVCQTTYLLSSNIESASKLRDNIINIKLKESNEELFLEEEKEHIRLTVVGFGNNSIHRGEDRGIASHNPIDDINKIYQLAERLNY